MGRRANTLKVAAASIGGVAERYSRFPDRVMRAEALAEIRAILRPVDVEKRPLVLAEAAASLTVAEFDWQTQALGLLVEAGADVDQARAVWAARPAYGGLPQDGAKGR